MKSSKGNSIVIYGSYASRYTSEIKYYKNGRVNVILEYIGDYKYKTEKGSFETVPKFRIYGMSPLY